MKAFLNYLAILLSSSLLGFLVVTFLVKALGEEWFLHSVMTGSALSFLMASAMANILIGDG